jgi:hypothetical protein
MIQLAGRAILTVAQAPEAVQWVNPLRKEADAGHSTSAHFFVKVDIVRVRVADVRLHEAVGERHQRHFVTIEQNHHLSLGSGVTPGATSACPRSPSPP